MIEASTHRTERATACFVRTVSHRELRNNSADILRAVAAGETIAITNNGIVAAVMSPPQPTIIDDLITRGQAGAARGDIRDFLARERVRSEASSAEIIADARGRW